MANSVKLRLFRQLVARRVETEVAREKGVSRSEAMELVDAGLTNAVWERALVESKAQVPKGLGDGKILQWIIDHEDQIVALVSIIMKIVLAFAEPPTPDGEQPAG